MVAVGLAAGPGEDQVGVVEVGPPTEVQRPAGGPGPPDEGDDAAAGQAPERRLQGLLDYVVMYVREGELVVRLDVCKTCCTTRGSRCAQISARCGFSDVHHFAKSFRRISGQTPGSYRRDNPSRDRGGEQGALSLVEAKKFLRIRKQQGRREIMHPTGRVTLLTGSRQQTPEVATAKKERQDDRQFRRLVAAGPDSAR